MAWIGPLIGAGVGLLTSGDQGSQTQTRNIDPRIVPYIYGAGGAGGLLGNVNNTLNTQLSSGGLNPMQNAGLEMQRQTLMNPAYTQGFDQMRSLGAGLLGQGVAGNPFTGSAQALGTFTPPPTFAPSQMRTIQPVQGGMRSAMGFNPGPPAMNANPNLGFNSTVAPAYQPIQAQQPAQGQNVGMNDLQAWIAQLLAQVNKTTQVPDFRGGNGGGGAGGTGVGVGDTGSGASPGDGSVGGI